MYNSQDILNQLDECSKMFSFPMLDNGYVYLAGTELTIYRDNKRWVIVIEIIGFNYRGGGHNGITNCLHIYGNFLNYKPGIQNENFLTLTSDTNCNTFDEDEEFFLNPRCKTFNLRGEILPLIQDREKYKMAGIVLEGVEKINAFEFLRLLDKLYHGKLIATETEIRQRIPVDIPEVFRLQDWHHPDLANNELPSHNETFKLIAKVLETGNTELYKPTLMPNTYWASWPEGGML